MHEQSPTRIVSASFICVMLRQGLWFAMVIVSPTSNSRLQGHLWFSVQRGHRFLFARLR
jgi:hypothetical protein